MNSTELHAEAADLREMADQIWARADTGDGATNRAGASLARRINERTDRAAELCSKLARAADSLDHRATLANHQEQEAARVRLTLDDVRGADYVRDEFGWHKVVRVSAKSVTVETPWSWTDRIALDKVRDVRKIAGVTVTGEA